MRSAALRLARFSVSTIVVDYDADLERALVSDLLQEELREKIERMQNQHRDEARVIMARAENGDPESIAYVKKAKEKIFDRLGRQSNENPFGATDLDAVAFTVTEDDAVFKSIARKF